MVVILPYTLYYSYYFGVAALVAGYSISHGQSEPLHSYWVGVVAATIIVPLLLAIKYNISKRKARQQRETWLKTHICCTSGRPRGCIVSCYLRIFDKFGDSMEPTIYGGLGTWFVVVFGIAILLDNFWLKAIFDWNSSDPDAQTLGWRVSNYR